MRFKERPASWVMTESGTAKRSVAPKSSKEVEACAVCHARRQQFSDDSKAQAQSFFDAFRPSLLSPGLYHVDGQQREEVYNYGSFLQSKMYAAGVTCSDCHNPHSGKLRAPGNAVCTQCHAPEKFDAPSHHHHPAGSKGAECAACHMPTTTYMIIDRRHDHSIRIPRPDRTYLLGTPNACNQCHSDKTAGWARDALKTWYPSPKPGAQDFAEAFDLGDRGAPGAQIALMRIAEAGSQSGIARASAISRLGRFPSPQALDLAIQSLKVDDLNVRAAAISLIAGADPATRRSVLVPLLHDKTRLIRMDAARALAGEPERDLAPDDRKALEAALAEYVEAQLFNAERPETHANLGSLYRDRGKMDAARPAFAKAIEIDPTFVAAAISLADLRRTEGNESAAEAILRQALSANPGSGPVQHALGLSLIRQKRATEAMVYLGQAARAAPEEPRFSYVYAVALHDMGQQADAIEVLKGALTRQPYDRDILWALTSFEVAARDYTSALKRAEVLNELEPGRPDIVRMLNAIRRQAR